MKTIDTPWVKVIRLQAADIITDSIGTGEEAGENDPMQTPNPAPGRGSIF